MKDRTFTISTRDLKRLREWCFRISPDNRSLQRKNRREAYDLGVADGFNDGLAIAARTILSMIDEV